MNEEDERVYAEQFSDELDNVQADGSYNTTENDLHYDMWIRQPQTMTDKELDYLNKDVAGANLDLWDIAHLKVLYIYLKNLKALHDNGIDTEEAQERTKEKIAQLVITSTGKDGFMQKIRVTKNIHRTGEYTTIEDKKSPVQFFSRRKR